MNRITPISLIAIYEILKSAIIIASGASNPPFLRPTHAVKIHDGGVIASFLPLHPIVWITHTVNCF